MVTNNTRVLTLFVWAVLAGVIFAPVRGVCAPKVHPKSVQELRQTDPNLTGAGVKFAVICRSLTYIDGEPQNDYLPNFNHNCFTTKQLNFHDHNGIDAGISPHSTAVCSILFGEDPQAYSPELGNFYYQGIVPQAQAHIYEFWHFLINNVFTGSPPDTDIITASMGSCFEDWWTRGIESMAQNYGIIVVAGIGNGTDVYDPPLYPGASANVIGVGVVDSADTENLAANLENYCLAYPEHSSLGPASDGRCKPDIVAVGNSMAADAKVLDKYEPTGSWSSFSTPIVAGTVGLLVQKAKQEPNLSLALSADGGNCVFKAILMNSAAKLPYWHKGRLTKDDDNSCPLDYIQGAGMLDPTQAYQQLIAGPNEPGNCSQTAWDLNELDKDPNAKNNYHFIVSEPAAKIITATMAWNRHYSSVYPFEALPEKDPDFKLELWAFDVNDPSNKYLLDYSNSSVDNVEHIYYPADANYTNYEIIVSHSDINEPNRASAENRYAIAWNVSENPNSTEQQEEPSADILWYDLNADGIVDLIDFTILFENIISSMRNPERYLLGDINSDGAIDTEDLKLILSQKNLKADWLNENKLK
jgi:hypothetical protein